MTRTMAAAAIAQMMLEEANSGMYGTNTF